MYGSQCENGRNESCTVFHSDPPERNVTLVLRIHSEWDDNLNQNSSQYISLTQLLVQILTPFYRAVAPQYFVAVVITSLRRGSILAEATGVYQYANNQTQIDYLNQKLPVALMNFINTTEILSNLSRNVSSTVTLDDISIPSPIINRTAQLNLSCVVPFRNYTINCSDRESCICEGTCKRIPGFCSWNGECFNQVNGSICSCYHKPFHKFTGTHCETPVKTIGLYTVLGAVLAACLLLVIIIIIIIIVYRRQRTRYPEKGDPLRWFSIEEEYFSFPQTDLNKVISTPSISPLGRTGKYNLDTKLNVEKDFTPGIWRPNLEKVDTSVQIRAKRPELVLPLSDKARE
ncbi:mucin-3A [Callorhinchus milii]|nr:mucin-3A [Callorhinchus milii]